MEQRRRKRLRIILWLLVAVWMGLIFCFSAENGEESSQTSGQVVRWLLEHLDRGYLSLSPAEQAVRREAWSFAVRKLAHFTVFAVLGMLSFAAFSVDLSNRRAFPAAVGLGVARAILDEVHQSFIPGRSCEFRDVCIDSAGVLFGAGVLWLIVCIVKHRRGMNESTPLS